MKLILNNNDIFAQDTFPVPSTVPSVPNLHGSVSHQFIFIFFTPSPPQEKKKKQFSLVLNWFQAAFPWGELLSQTTIPASPSPLCAVLDPTSPNPYGCAVVFGWLIEAAPCVSPVLQSALLELQSGQEAAAQPAPVCSCVNATCSLLKCFELERLIIPR